MLHRDAMFNGLDCTALFDSFCFGIRRGSTIAKIVGRNVIKLEAFDDIVTMYVYEEIINARKLTEIINEDHENVKYLPGHKLPQNVVCTKRQISAVSPPKSPQETRILIYVLIHFCIRYISVPLPFEAALFELVRKTCGTYMNTHK